MKRMRRSWRPGVAYLASLTVVLGCSGAPPGEGTLGEPGVGTGGGVRAGGSGGALPGQGGSSSSGSSASGGALLGVGGSADPSVPLEARVWRLTHEQYRKSVLDLVGVDPDLTNFAPETGNGKFTNFSSTSFVQVDLAQNYFDVARSIAKGLSTVALSGLTSCKLEALCHETFIDELGARAFRMPVPAEAKSRLDSLFELASGEGDPEAGFRAVLIGVLNSPLFLYRKELGPLEDATSPTFELTAPQVVELLAFSVLNGPPPEWLRTATSSASLKGDQLSEAVGRLLLEPDFKAQLELFLTEWLEVNLFDGVEKSEVYPGFAEAKPKMKAELAAFLAQSGAPASDLRNLLLDPVPTVAPTLDAFYYSDASAQPDGERIGILGLGTVLSSQAKTYLTSPTLRGKFVQSRLFCREINLPEGFTPPPLSETEALGEAQSTRELYEQHLSGPVCAECHRMTDNIGFALEAFDGAGRFRTLDTTQGASVPLNLAAELTDSDVDRPISGPGDLVQALSESDQVRHCFARQAFRFFFGQVEASPNIPAVLAARQRLGQSRTLQELMIGLLSSPNTATRQREVSP